MSRIIAIIPARSGSKGVNHKNIRDLGGKPVIAWSIAACLKSSLIDRTFVSTDSEYYASLARSFGAEVPFLRPPEISTDRSTDLEFINHAIDWFSSNDKLPDYIVHIRPSTPLRSPQVIDQAIDLFVDTSRATSLRSVHQMSESAYKCFEISKTGNLTTLFSGDNNLDVANNARQEFPSTYMANGYVDVLSVDHILKHGAMHGNYVLPFITPYVDEIDTEDDFARIVHTINHSPDIQTSLFRIS